MVTRHLTWLYSGLGIAAAVGFVIMRRRRLQQPPPPPPPPATKLAVLHARDGSMYNEAVLPMLKELFEDVGARIALEEIDLQKRRVAEILPLLGSFDGFILPGSIASVAAVSSTRDSNSSLRVRPH